MDTDLFLQRLRDLPLEEGKALVQEYAQELQDVQAFGTLLTSEALKQLYTNPAISLKLSPACQCQPVELQQAPSEGSAMAVVE